MVTSMVSQALQTEGRRIIYSLMNPNSDQFAGTDQTINADQRGNITELDKIPDVVRSLREFSGQPGEFSSWRKSVERVLKIYEPLRGSPKYFGIINVIRNKIVGHADHVLESYNTPLNWDNISRCLTLHYADKRDLGTLEYQLTSLVQGNSSIQEFYQEVYSHLSLILNKISSIEVGGEALNLLMHGYREKALDTFIKGLKGDLPRLLGIREPADLPQALHLCLKLENQTYRTQYAVATNNNVKRMHNPTPPALPPRRSNRNTLPNYQIPFYPQLTHLPQPPMNTNQRSNQFNNNYGSRQPPFQSNPFQNQSYNQVQGTNTRPPPRPQPRGEPMETSTIGTARVNYVNRPQHQNQQRSWPPAPKRPNNLPQQPNYPTKLQRNFHLNTSTQENPSLEEPDLKQYYDASQLDDQQYDQTFNNYIEPLTQEQTDNDVPEIISEFSDIHFLD